MEIRRSRWVWCTPISGSVRWRPTDASRRAGSPKWRVPLPPTSTTSCEFSISAARRRKSRRECRRRRGPASSPSWRGSTITSRRLRSCPTSSARSVWNVSRGRSGDARLRPPRPDRCQLAGVAGPAGAARPRGLASAVGAADRERIDASGIAGSAGEGGKRAFAAMREWDGRCGPESRGALAYKAFVRGFHSARLGRTDQGAFAGAGRIERMMAADIDVSARPNSTPRW